MGSQPPKPKIVGDITSMRADANRGSFSRLPSRLNLGYQRAVHIPLTSIMRYTIYVLSVLFLVLGSVTAPTDVSRAQNAPTDAERQALEVQLKDLEGQIGQFERRNFYFKFQDREAQSSDPGDKSYTQGIKQEYCRDAIADYHYGVQYRHAQGGARGALAESVCERANPPHSDIFRKPSTFRFFQRP